MSKDSRNTIDCWNGEFLNPPTSRRKFLAGSALALCALPFASRSASALTAPDDDKYVAEARYYKKLEEGRVECQLCPRKCQVADKERGYCGVRENRNGSYKTLVHSRVVALNIDPIEKKPLYHFLPGSEALSLATAGCNIECKFCQNWNISQFRPEQVKSTTITPSQMVRVARERSVPIIAYTYSEPVIFYEYMDDIAVEAQKAGVESVMISNGYILQQPMEDLIPHLAAVKVDLKAFTEHFYKEYCSGELKPVLDILKLLSRSKIWYEIVVLIIPTLNDGKTEIHQMTSWIRDELGPDVPVHFSRYHPTYKIKNIPVTPVSTLQRCYDIAKEEGMNYVYCGNIPGHPSESTFCPKCGKVVIKRFGYSILENNLKNGLCTGCGREIPGIW